MRRLSYVLCDVFTDRPLTANALAVFTDASELSAAQMQALAREMNLSETSCQQRCPSNRPHEHPKPVAWAHSSRQPTGSFDLRASTQRKSQLALPFRLHCAPEQINLELRC